MNELSITHPELLAVPSILRQTGWQCGVYDFGKARKPGVDYFNCSILKRTDGLWLITRRATYDWRDRQGYNDLVAFSLDGTGTKPHMGRKIMMGQRFPGEHFEDPRVMPHDGKCYISACNFIRTPRGMNYPHQMISEVDMNWELKERFDPRYGKNGPDVGTNSSHEKNWLWFWHEELPHMVYQSVPHTVVRFTKKFRSVQTFYSEWDNKLWQYGQIRGGTSPVMWEGLYWTFFHSSTYWNGVKRQYHMGAYAFEPGSPFAIRKITMDPLLSGSQQDRMPHGKLPCVFACGAIMMNGNWLVVGGLNDMDCFHVTIPHKDLEDRMLCL